MRGKILSSITVKGQAVMQHYFKILLNICMVQ